MFPLEDELVFEFDFGFDFDRDADEFDREVEECEFELVRFEDDEEIDFDKKLVIFLKSIFRQTRRTRRIGLASIEDF